MVYSSDGVVMRYPYKKYFILLTTLPLVLSMSVVFAKDKLLEESSTRLIDSKLLAFQHQQAKIWGLDLKQWQDYKRELEGVRGLWSPNLHPLAVLGMREGITTSERQRLAVKLVKIERARVERELAFEKAYQTANYRLFGHIPLLHLMDQKTMRSLGITTLPAIRKGHE